jgi:hypothetical protein
MKLPIVFVILIKILGANNYALEPLLNPLLLLSKSGLYRQIIIQFSNIKFHKNRFNGFRIIPCKQKAERNDRRCECNIPSRGTQTSLKSVEVRFDSDRNKTAFWVVTYALPLWHTCAFYEHNRTCVICEHLKIRGAKGRTCLSFTYNGTNSCYKRGSGNQVVTV